VFFIPRPLVVKRGGHGDQLSRSYPVMDRYRIIALVKMLESGVLNADQRRMTLGELRKKCLIVGRGAEKRGRSDEAAYYSSLPFRFEEQGEGEK
jgi:hypothetical protein